MSDFEDFEDFEDMETDEPRSDFIKAAEMFGGPGNRGTIGRLMVIWPKSTGEADTYSYATCDVVFCDGDPIPGLIDKVPGKYRDVRFSAGRQARMLIDRIENEKFGPVCVRAERAKVARGYAYGFKAVAPEDIARAKGIVSKL